jgi:hypothetical protein
MAAGSVTPGDTVRVQAGTYVEGVTNVLGGAGDEWVTFVADGAVTVSNALGSAVTLLGTHRVAYDGFTFNSAAGDIVSLNEAQGCRLVRCAVVGGQVAGVSFLRSHENELAECGVDRNKVNGVRIYLSGKNRFERCRFNANTGSGVVCGKYGGGSVGGGDRSTVRNSLFWGNTGTAFFTARDSASHDWTIESSVFNANGAGIHFDYFGGDRAKVQNTAVSFNTGNGIYRGGSVITVLNNDVYGNGTDYLGTFTPVNSISADPLFRAAGTGNFRLASGSPCIDAGTNLLWMAAGEPTALDFDGDARIVNGVVDIGAFELNLNRVTVLTVR